MSKSSNDRSDELRGILEHLDHDTVSALSGAEMFGVTSQARYLRWLSSIPTPSVEYLLPRLRRKIVRQWPEYMLYTPGHADLSQGDLMAAVESIGPWMVQFRLRNDHMTIDTTTLAAKVDANNYLFRLDLINGTLADLLGGEIATTSVLDIGCNAGFFSLDLAARGAQHVDGVDLRCANINQARFLAEHYGIDNVAFHVSDADDVAQGRQYDVVLNLGLLYHVVNPLQHLRQTYELCSRYAIIDSICHTEPVAAFMLFGDKDNDHPFEGRDEWEFHPTYRGAIEAIRYAGFSDVIEIVGDSDPAHKTYAAGKRRCFLAIK